MVLEFLLNLTFKKWFFEQMFGTPRLCKKVCLFNIYWYQKKFSVLVQAVQNNWILGSIWEGSGGVVPPNYVNFLSFKHLLVAF